MYITIATIAVLAAVGSVWYSRSTAGELKATVTAFDQKFTSKLSAWSQLYESSLKIEDEHEERLKSLESAFPAEVRSIRTELRRVSLLAEDLMECSVCTRIVPLKSGSRTRCHACSRAA